MSRLAERRPRAAPAVPRDRLTLLYSAERIRGRVRALARAIAADYVGRDPVLVGVLEGAFVFLADLLRALPVPAAVDFVGLSSYGSGTVTITKPLQGAPYVGFVFPDGLVVGYGIDHAERYRGLSDLHRLRPGGSPAAGGRRG